MGYMKVERRESNVKVKKRLKSTNREARIELEVESERVYRKKSRVGSKKCRVNKCDHSSETTKTSKYF
jgi:hypothetical protein